MTTTKLAMVFPGQGSQSPGMLSALAATTPIVEATFNEASSVLGVDLWTLVCEGPEQALNATEVTQPAMLAADIAVWRVWQGQGQAMPDFLAGHSLGEFSALVAAESLAFDEALRLVQRRAQLMQAAVPIGKGAMAAILGLADEVVTAICREGAEGEVVSAANLNAPGQVVIAGDIDAVDRTIILCKEAGAKRAVRLPVSVPSHCALMKPAAEALEADVAAAALAMPRIPIIHNVNAGVVDDLTALRAVLVAQLCAPVLWSQSMAWLHDQGVDTVFECGPGRVLTGLGRRIVKDCQWQALEDPAAWPAV